jgi:hypothetical protein
MGLRVLRRVVALPCVARTFGAGGYSLWQRGLGLRFGGALDHDVYSVYTALAWGAALRLCAVERCRCLISANALLHDRVALASEHFPLARPGVPTPSRFAP